MSQCIALQAYLFTSTKASSIPVIVALTRCRSRIVWLSGSVIGCTIGALMDTESQTGQLHTARHISWRGSQAPYSDVWPPSFPPSHIVHAPLTIRIQSIYLVAGLLFGRRYLACNLYIPRCKQPTSSGLQGTAPSFVPIPKNNIFCSCK
jgi:hypothetical protein